MADELDLATHQLNIALDRYNSACASLRNQYVPGRGKGLRAELAGRVAHEFSQASSYENEIRHFKSVLNQLRNFSGSGLAISINRLPPEVLARIFEDVVNTGPCPVLKHRLQARPRSMFLKDPILLSHVCSYWRRVALDTAVLWSHIDINPGLIRLPKISGRIDSYIGRSANTLLDVHIARVKFRHKPYYEPSKADPVIIELLALASSRIRSLTMVIPEGCEEVYRSFLVTCFSRCTPGTFTSVSIRHAEFDGIHIGTSLLKPSEMGPGKDRMMGLPSKAVEAVWDAVKILQLETFRPTWTSKAYHGLSELRLVKVGSISHSRLRSILLSSPRLRVFELDLKVQGYTLSDDSITAVRLENLEILILGGVKHEQLGPVLQLIAPGSNPLSLSLVNPYLGSSEFTSKDELARFVARSNLTRLCVHECDAYSQLAEVLSLVPDVRTVALNGLSSGAIEAGFIPPEYSIDVLYVIKLLFSV